MTRIDPSERADMIDAAKQNYIAGEYGIVRVTAVLAACGLNATEINDFIAENREAALAAFEVRNSYGRKCRHHERKPVR